MPGFRIIWLSLRREHPLARSRPQVANDGRKPWKSVVERFECDVLRRFAREPEVVRRLDGAVGPPAARKPELDEAEPGAQARKASIIAQLRHVALEQDRG